MGIINSATGQNYSDDEIKSFMATATPAQIAQQAASMGLNQGQIAGALQTGGLASNATDANNQINSFMGGSSGYSFGAGGILGAAQAPQATPQATSPGGISIGGQNYTAQQVKDFYANGGNERQFLEQAGITDLWGQRDLTLQARGIAGPGTMAGDAGLQNYFKQYQQANPNGRYANNYQGWLQDDGANTRTSMRSGLYTGAPFASDDYGFGGVYGPGSAGYGKPGYASGYGPRGDGGSWDGTGTPPAGSGSNGAGGGGAGAGGAGSGGGGSSSSSSSSAGGGTAPWNVTPDQTVEGRINGILNPNNPIIQQARTGALEQMNARGMLNSSLATTASDAAAYQAAIPIAAADAATFAKAAGYNADQTNQFTQADMNRATQVQLANINADTQKYLAGLDITQKNQAQALQLSNATLLQTNSQAAQIFNTAVSAINNITQNNQMDADTKTRATANVWRDVQSQLNVIGATSGLNLTTQLNFANYPGFDAQGKWVGFPDGTATTPPGAIPPTSPVIERDAGGSA